VLRTLRYAPIEGEVVRVKAPVYLAHKKILIKKAQKISNQQILSILSCNKSLN